MRDMCIENRSYSTCDFLLLLFVLLHPFRYCYATDTLTQSQQLSVGQTLISAGQIFELGFFSPGNSSKQYVGIWYKSISMRRIIWVMNRETPINVTEYSGSSLIIGSDKNLRLMDGKQNAVWLTNIVSSVQSNDSVVAMLSDNGAFILRDNISGLILWDSFDYPGDTSVTGGMIGMNTKTGEKRFLSSWKSEDDPSPGNFVLGLEPQMPPQAFIWNGSKTYWRSGPWDGRKFIGVESHRGYSDSILVQNNQRRTIYFTRNTFNISYFTIMIITPVGSLKTMTWDEAKKEWFVYWEAPEAPANPCDIYGICGPFGLCNKYKSPICGCLKEFIPKSNEEWSEGNWKSGCVRRTELLCKQNISSLATQKRNKDDGFLKLSNTKLPDVFEYINDIGDPSGCEMWCSNNCSCVAYAFVATIGCIIWGADLPDIQLFSLNGDDLFLRLAHSELGKEKTRVKLITISTTVSGTLLFGAFIYILRRWITSQRGKSTYKIKDCDRDTSEIPIFDFNTILVATNDFDKTNKLGEGGFGPVYKGKLKDGKEIAVKRLSSHSGQGEREFMNEITLISKLQHRNLVRLLGCCTEGEEKLLVYEYMTNKSLDNFLFDPTKRVELHWVKRFNIIEGVARGLLYLHRDSCLRVIHRDLKASNVLLDNDLNPKISDLGLARTFLVTQELVNTQRVVGTHGYMSPEYALGGIFSEKSDVFSFGVLVLEIVSSTKNTCFHYHENYLSLLGYAWALWNECRVLELLDESLAADSFSPLEVKRCIHVGLLCVQDHPNDRPPVSDIVSMLNSETDLPQPKQPTFPFQNFLRSDLRSECNNLCSVNEVTESMIKEGR